MNTQLSQSIVADRVRLGMSQQDVARLVGVSQQSVAKWEAGIAAPRGKRLSQLARVLGKKSLTAEAVDLILNSPGNRGSANMDQINRPVSQAQALDALAAAAQEIAKAAQALAHSVATIAKQPPQPPPDQH